MLKSFFFYVPVKDTLPSVGLLIARIFFAGFMFFGHGLGKLTHFSLDASFPDPLGIGPVASMAGAIFSEVVCAVLLLLGLGTRAASIPLIFTMLVAAFIVHSADPFFMSGGAAKEPALLYLGGYLLIALAGPGRYSLDHFLAKK